MPRVCESKPKSGASPRLAMLAVVRNEIDVIDVWIRYHAACGIDCFVVLDNGSTDGTRERLEELAEQFDIQLLHDASDGFAQNRWMTRLGVLARTDRGADWAIASDADEFWIADPGVDLKSVVARGRAVKRFARFNMVIDEQHPFYRASYCARGEVAYPKLAELARKHMSVILKRPAPKVAVRLKGLIRIAGGNHGAWHLASTPKPKPRAGLTIYHYPIRSFERFVQSLRRYREILLANPNAPIGAHWKRWTRLRADEELMAEYRRLVFTPTHCEALFQVGLLQRCYRPGEAIADALSGSAPCASRQNVPAERLTLAS